MARTAVRPPPQPSFVERAAAIRASAVDVTPEAQALLLHAAAKLDTVGRLAAHAQHQQALAVARRNAAQEARTRRRFAAADVYEQQALGHDRAVALAAERAAIHEATSAAAVAAAQTPVIEEEPTPVADEVVSSPRVARTRS